MIVWTFQKKWIVDYIKNNKIIYAYFADNCKNTYKYILSEYNKNTNNNYKGLFFVHCGSSNFPVLNNIHDLYNCINEAGCPSGTTFDMKSHYLLKLDIPDDIFILKIDFYKFTDLMFFTDIEPDKNEIENCKNYLYYPNNPNGDFELIQGNIPIIKKEWITEIISNFYI